MKRKIIIISLLIVCCCLSIINVDNTQVFAYQNTGQKIIVKGVGEVFATPDMATISMGVETTNLDITKAENENSKVVQRLINILLKNNIENKDIKTTNYSIYKNQDYKTHAFLGYQVTNQFDITVYQLEDVGRLIALLTKNGANVLRGVTFSLTNVQELQKAALEKALDSAKSKATILGGENIVITKIVEESVYNNFPRHSDMAVFSSAERSNVLAGECKVSATLVVECETK